MEQQRSILSPSSSFPLPALFPVTALPSQPTQKKPEQGRPPFFFATRSPLAARLFFALPSVSVGDPPRPRVIEQRAPTQLQEEPFESPVQSVSAWRKQARAERDAGFDRDTHRVLVSFFACDVCGCHIGPNYHEEELYLYPVFDETVCILDTYKHFTCAALHICGGCARNRRLPEVFKMAGPLSWETTLLTRGSDSEPPRKTNMTDPLEMRRVRRALQEHVAQFHQFFFLVVILRLGFSLSLFMRQETRTRKEAVREPLPFVRPIGRSHAQALFTTHSPTQTQRRRSIS